MNHSGKPVNGRFAGRPTRVSSSLFVIRVGVGLVFRGAGSTPPTLRRGCAGCVGVVPGAAGVAGVAGVAATPTAGVTGPDAAGAAAGGSPPGGLVAANAPSPT